MRLWTNLVPPQLTQIDWKFMDGCDLNLTRSMGMQSSRYEIPGSALQNEFHVWKMRSKFDQIPLTQGSRSFDETRDWISKRHRFHQNRGADRSVAGPKERPIALLQNVFDSPNTIEIYQTLPTQDNQNLDPKAKARNKFHPMRRRTMLSQERVDIFRTNSTETAAAELRFRSSSIGNH